MPVRRIERQDTVSTTPTAHIDLLICSPDGESRGILFRVGDLFPMDPRPHQRLAINEPASDARPWGLRYLRPQQIRAGRHESDTKEYTTGGGGDNKDPEDSDTD